VLIYQSEKQVVSINAVPISRLFFSLSPVIETFHILRFPEALKKIPYGQNYVLFLLFVLCRGN
jgi:hypothetical protein